MSGFNLNVSSTIKEAERQIYKFERQGLKRAVLRSINKTGVTVNKEAVKRVGKKTGLPAKRIKSKLEILEANKNTLTWSLTGLRATTNIIEWVISLNGSGILFKSSNHL